MSILGRDFIKESFVAVKKRNFQVEQIIYIYKYV